LNDLLKHGIKV